MAAGKRQRINPSGKKGGSRFITRDAKGRIKSNVSVGRSLKADRRRKSDNVPKKAGYGHRGDYTKKGGIMNMMMEAQPNGDGRVLGQSTATTDYTPVGLGAEDSVGGGFKMGFGATVGVIAGLMVAGGVGQLLDRMRGKTSE